MWIHIIGTFNYLPLKIGNFWGYREKGPLGVLLVGMSISTAIMENSMEGSLKLEVELSHGPAIPLLSMYPKEIKSVSGRDINTSMFITALFTIAKTWKKPICPSKNGWIKGVWLHTPMCVHTHREDSMLLSHKK